MYPNRDATEGVLNWESQSDEKEDWTITGTAEIEAIF